MTKRILFDCERLKYPNTGLYTFCKSLGSALIQNKHDDEQITAYIPSNAINIFGKNVKYFIQKPWHKIFIPRAEKFNIWHCSNQVSRYFPTDKNIKIVLTIHDLNFLIEKKNRRSKVDKLLKQIQKQIDRASAVVCISHFVAAQVKEYFNLEQKDVAVIYNGCTINNYPEVHSFNDLPSKPFLFTIGTVLPKKNFHVLPALLKHNDYELIIAGNYSDPDYIKKIKAEALKFGVSDRVKIIGAISDEKRSWYYKNCKAFVFPSMAEGFGLPVIEAMHYSKPVFLSNLTSLPEIGGDAAYYFDNFDPESMQKALIDGLNDFSTGNMAKKAKQRALSFNWNNTARAYLEIYKSI